MPAAGIGYRQRVVYPRQRIAYPPIRRLPDRGQLRIGRRLERSGAPDTAELDDSDKGGEDIRKTDHLYDDVGDEIRYGLQDMLGTSKVPVEVRRAELAAKIVEPGTQPTAEQMTELSMAVRKFNERERNHSKRRGKWSVR